MFQCSKYSRTGSVQSYERQVAPSIIASASFLKKTVLLREIICGIRLHKRKHMVIKQNGAVVQMLKQSQANKRTELGEISHLGD